MSRLYPQPYAASMRLGYAEATAVLACAASVVGHALIAAAFAALWIAPWQLEKEKNSAPPPPPEPIWVETVPGADVPVVDQGEAKDVDPSEVAAVMGEAVEAPVSVKEEVLEQPLVQDLRASLPEADAGESVDAAQTNAKVEAPATPPKNTKRRRGIRLKLTAAGVEAYKRDHAPDLAARFTKELPRYAADVDAWKSLAVGATPEITVTIELDEGGRVVLPKEPKASPPNKGEAALDSSVERTLRALVTKLALPGLKVQAGVLRVTVKADIADGAERKEGDEIELSFSYDSKTRRGAGTFILRSGRTVTFEVKVSAVEPKAAPADVDAEDGAEAEAAEPAPMPSAPASAEPAPAAPTPSGSSPTADAPAPAP